MNLIDLRKAIAGSTVTFQVSEGKTKIMWFMPKSSLFIRCAKAILCRGCKTKSIFQSHHSYLIKNNFIEKYFTISGENKVMHLQVPNQTDLTHCGFQLRTFIFCFIISSSIYFIYIFRQKMMMRQRKKKSKSRNFIMTS